jgi:tellurite resistance protein
MAQPPAFQKITERGLWRRTPPAIFAPVMGLLGLGLAWRRGLGDIGLSPGLAEAFLGAVLLLFAFCLTAYVGKLVQRPGVLIDDLQILPGRAGVAAASLSVSLSAAVLVPYAPGLAFGLASLGLVVQIALVAVVGWVLMTGPAEGRVVSPVFHLTFVGFIIGPVAWVPLGQTTLAAAIWLMALPVALAIWAVSLRDLVRRIPPAPLRPLLAVHLAPASLFSLVASLLGWNGAALGFALLAGAIAVALLIFSRWITEAGFSALWGAFTFPSAALANAWLAVGWTLPGLLVMVAASAIILPIAYKVLQAWAKGGLAVKTNAATA